MVMIIGPLKTKADQKQQAKKSREASASGESGE